MLDYMAENYEEFRMIVDAKPELFGRLEEHFKKRDIEAPRLVRRTPPAPPAYKTLLCMKSTT